MSAVEPERGFLLQPVYHRSFCFLQPAAKAMVNTSVMAARMYDSFFNMGIPSFYWLLSYLNECKNCFVRSRFG